MKRVFAAIVPSTEAIDQLASHISRLRADFPDVRVNWVRSENLHMTLHFAGEVDDTRLASFQSHVDAAAQVTQAFETSLGTAGAFVDKRLGRSVLWVGLEEPTGALAGAVRELKTLEGEKSNRFVPHLTLARVRGDVPSQLMDAHREGVFNSRFRIEELVVFASELTRSGSIYTVLSRHSLAIVAPS